ncbi:MAG: vWA domain-containing protein [Pseudomonadota bacterium]
MLRYVFAFLVVSVTLGLGPVALAQEKPLLIEGKERLFQRVLLRAATSEHNGPDSTAGAALAPLTPLYVYERAEDWIKVGRDEDGSDLFWVPTAAAVQWNQNIVATFEASENVERVLFFNELDPIYDLLDLESPGLRAAELRETAQEAESGGPTYETIVALGPRKVIDQRRNLYVMPILDFQEEVFDNGAFVNLLKVAVARADPDRARSSAPPPPPNATPQNYKAGVVFVVDTTISMDPYIRATKDALESVFAMIDEAGVSDAVSFGLIGYRDSLEAAPGLGYATRTYVTLQEGLKGEEFLQGIAEMKEATTSSRNFREDSYAGVSHALKELDWSGFAGRFIVVVSDAGPRSQNDEFSATKLSGAGVNSTVREQLGGAIAVMHLKTPDGVNDHVRAEAEYRALASFPNQPPFYFEIENGAPRAFEAAATELGTRLAQQVLSFRNAPDDVLDKNRSPILEGNAQDDGGDRFAGLASAGRTMQLAYLGTLNGEAPPDVFEAYVADRDFERTGLKPLSIRVLVSKAQLGALYDALNIIVQKGEENIIDPDQFFSQVLGAAADMSRSPDKVARQSDPTLAEAAAIDEYIEDLPYQSRIMGITEDDWLDMSFSEQASIINDLYDKIQRYKEFNEATDLWVNYLGGGADAENQLYPLPLDELP